MRSLAAVVLLAAAVLAGGSPETTLLVVNARSPASRLVANEYARLRDLPAENLVFLEGVPGLGLISLDAFRERIWAPVAAHMHARGIGERIDLIVYSADLPYGVELKGLIPDPNEARVAGNAASLTGLTYLIRHVEAGEPFWNLQINRYFRLDPSAAGGGGSRPATSEERAHAVRAGQALQAGHYQEAAEAFEALLATYPDAPQPWYNYACCLARLGRKDKALEALVRAAETGFRNAQHAAGDADLASLRDDPRFAQVVARMQQGTLAFHPAHGFRSAYGWANAADPVTGGDAGTAGRYYLSTQLAYTGRWGNSVPETLAFLRAAAASDGTRPGGTVYICRNSNVRSTAREPFFASLEAGLRAIGRKVELLDNTTIPQGKEDVIGAVLGTAGFDWGRSKSRLLPGSIAEHLTSFGAHFGTPGQTKLSELLRYGAAGSSGTVTEPFSIHQKFPNPMMHVFYAEGCSLAEAFFQSIWGPYQLMVAGDGLARPFARFVDVEVEAPPAPWTGRVTLRPRAEGCRFELWVDGRPVSEGEELSFDTTGVEDGHHEVRVVAVANDRIETRSYARLAARVENHGAGPVVEMRGEGRDGAVELRASGATRIEVTSGNRLAACADGSRCSVPTADLGPGPVTLVPLLTLGGGRVWRAEPVVLEIPAPAPVEASGDGAPRLPGLRGTADGAEIVVVGLGDRHGGPQLREHPDARAGRSFDLAGELEAPADGFFQLVVEGAGTVTLEVAGKILCADATLDGPLFLPVGLAKGWHPVHLALQGSASLQVHLGGAQVLAPLQLRHGGRPALKEDPEMRAEDGGIVLEWKRTTSNIAAVAIFPKGDTKEFPTAWRIESTTGSPKFRPVKEVATLVAPGTTAPAFVELSFKPLRARRLRLVPGHGDAPAVERVLALGRPK